MGISKVKAIYVKLVPGLFFAATLVAVIFGIVWLRITNETEAPSDIEQPTTVFSGGVELTDLQPSPTEFEKTLETATIPTTIAVWPLSVDSDEAAIRTALLNSRGQWLSIFGDARVTTNTKGSQFVEREQAWVVQPSQSLWISGQEGAAPSLLRVTSGIHAVMAHADGEQIEYSTLDPQIGSLAMMFFPKGISNRAGTFTSIREETIAGRNALVVEWAAEEGRVEDRFWIDIQAGIILKWENIYPAPTEYDGRIEPSEVQIQIIRIDVDVPDVYFDLEQGFPQAFLEEIRDFPSP